MNSSSWKVTNTIPLARTPALRSNNLSWGSGGNFAFVQRDSVLLVSNSSDKDVVELKNPNTKTIIQTKFILLDESLELLAVTSSKGLDIWDGTGKKHLCSLPLSACIDSPVNGKSLSCSYLSGVCGILGAPLLCVGTSEGDLALCYCDGKSIDVEDFLRGQTNAICDLSSSTTYIASGDEFGGVSVWIAESRDLVCNFPSTGVPCTSVATRGDMIIAGFESGAIRIFQISSQHMKVEIDAHCRPISAIDIHSRENMFLSAGEDSFINVWKYPDRDLQSLNISSSIEMADDIITGACFSKSGKLLIGIASYDSKELKVIRAQ